MGLADRMKKKETGFTPSDLNEETIQKLFKRCIATDSTKDVSGVVLFPKQYGYKESSTPMAFDRPKIHENRATLRFLFGQLKLAHDNDMVLTSSNGILKYDDTIWTKDPKVLLQFLHLGVACGFYPAFNATEKSTTMVAIHPTFSPKDPKFAEWYAKGEWCQRFHYEINRKPKTDGPDFEEK